MSAIHRWNRGLSLDRAGELLGSISPTPARQERTPIEPLLPLSFWFQDGFEAGDTRPQGGLDAVGGRPQGTLDTLLISADFQQRLNETLAGTSPRALQVKQVESTYQSFWKDSQDFSARKGPALTVPEPPRFVSPAETAWKGRVLTVPQFHAPAAELPEAARVPPAAHAVSPTAEARRAPAASFTLLGYAQVRG